MYACYRGAVLLCRRIVWQVDPWSIGRRKDDVCAGFDLYMEGKDLFSCFENNGDILYHRLEKTFCLAFLIPITLGREQKYTFRSMFFHGNIRLTATHLASSLQEHDHLTMDIFLTRT